MIRFSPSIWTQTLRFYSMIKKTPLQLFQQKIKEAYNPRIKMLYELQRTHKVEKHITSKNVNELSVEEIYFYLNHKEIFTRPSFDLKIGLLCNDSLTAYEKFLVAEHFPLLSESMARKVLIKSLNQHCRGMPSKELIYCLKRMINFNEISEHLDFFSLTMRLAEAECELDYIEILYYTIYIDLNDGIINKESCTQKLEEIEEVFIKSGRDFSVKYIYFLEYIEKELGITIRNKSIGKRKELIFRNINCMEQDELEEGIKVLDFYPEFLRVLSVESLNSQSYLRYLYYVKEHVKQLENLQKINHEIPNKIIPQLKKRQFMSIISLRIELGFDKLGQLGKKLKRFFTKELQCVQGFIEYLDVQDIEDPQIWMDLEQNFIKKLHLNNKKYDSKKIKDHFDVLVIIKILAKMNNRRLGSAKFWKATLRFVHDLLLDKEFLKEIPQKNQNIFLYHCYEIYCGRAMQEHIEEALKTLLLISLNENHWEMNLLFYFISTLSRGKIGDDQIWYAIQNKILSLQLDKITSTSKRAKVRTMVTNFINMRKGTYRFINKMSKVSYMSDMFDYEAVAKELQKDQ